MDLNPLPPEPADDVYNVIDPPEPALPISTSPSAPEFPSERPTPAPGPPAALTPITPSPPGRLGRLAAKFRRTSKEAARDPQAGAGPGPGPDTSAGPRLRPRRRPVRTLHVTLPAWMVSVLVHIGVLTALGLASLSNEVRQTVANINAAMVDTSLAAKQAEELTPILAEPTNAPREIATGLIEASTPGLGGGLGTGSGPPSATPKVAVARPVGERSSLPARASVGGALTPLAIKPPTSILTREIGGGIGGLVAGDVARPTEGIGEALDQVAREILRFLERNRVTVVWMFDESGSMRDDQRAIKDKFARIAAELNQHVGSDKKAQNSLTHVVIGFGEQFHPEVDQPTSNLDHVSSAIERLRVDETGIENTFQALATVASRYGQLVNKDRRVMIVLATDESGDDGLLNLEKARTQLVRANIPVYVIGRQAVFGKTTIVLPYTDPLTGDRYWPPIRRGPESADFECLQWDGMHPRWDEQPSGFAPYELARLTKETGGIYFLLPSEESLRSVQREKAYSMATLKEYVPDTDSRSVYNATIAKNPFRRTLMEVVSQTREFGFRHHYPVEPPALVQAISEEYPKVQAQLNFLMQVEPRLKALEKERAHEPEKRWQAHYDLILAQIVAYEIQAYEYRACLQEMAQKAQAGQLIPKNRPIPGQLVVEWEINHSPDYRAPKQETEKKRAEATTLLKKVIDRHPNTPWADLAQDEIRRGFGCRVTEWTHSPKYDERAKLVPKY